MSRDCASLAAERYILVCLYYLLFGMNGPRERSPPSKETKQFWPNAHILVCHAARAKQWCSIARARGVVVAIFVVTSVFSLPFAFRYRTVWTSTAVSAGPSPNNATNASVDDVVAAVHIEVSPQYRTLVPNLKVNYQNWVMGPFDLGNCLFFRLVFQPQLILLSINRHGKTCHIN